MHRGEIPFSLVFSRTEVLSKLTENRERYVDTYATVKEAFKVRYDNYRAAHAEWTAKMLAGKLDENEDTEPRSPVLPVDRTETYDLYIAMLENAKDSEYGEFELTVGLFAQLWMDRWDFIREHIRTMTVWSEEMTRTDSTSTSTSTSTSADLSSALLAYGVK